MTKWGPVRFLDENNLKLRTLSVPGEGPLLSHCSPCLQDLVIFALNTGLRLGGILNLTWKEVDVEDGILTILVRKSPRLLDLPLNEKALCVMKRWYGIRKCEYVLYNPETGGQWKGLWLGLKKSCRKANLHDVT
jgi:integrase